MRNSIIARFGRRGRRSTSMTVVGTFVAAFLAGGVTPACAGTIIINPIYTIDQTVVQDPFATSITADPSAAAIMAGINLAIQDYQTKIFNPITVNIVFVEDNSPGALAGSLSHPATSVTYSQYRAALVTHAIGATDATVLANLPATAANPANGGTGMSLRNPLARALGLNNSSSSAADPDGVIYLGTQSMNFTRTSINPANYDLKAVVQHEINEVLGITSALNGNLPLLPTVRPMDLFRYDLNGARSLTNNPTATAFFSLDGKTKLEQFNQDGVGDMHDWYAPGGQIPQVQDAYATPGAIPNMGVELTALDAVGFSLAPLPPLLKYQGGWYSHPTAIATTPSISSLQPVIDWYAHPVAQAHELPALTVSASFLPEPSTFVLAILGAVSLAVVAWRRNRLRRA